MLKKSSGNEIAEINEKKSDDRVSSAKVRFAYTKPCLTRYGDVREVTLGSSPGAGESGGVPKKLP